LTYLQIRQLSYDINSKLAELLLYEGDMMEENVTREEILDWYAKGGRNYRNCKAKYIDLSNTNLEGMYFKNLDFEGSNFSHTILRNTALEWVSFDDCDLTYADFTGADFCNVSFYGADFKGAIFKDVNFCNVMMDYEEYKMLPENLKLQVLNDDYNERLNNLGFFLDEIMNEKFDKENYVGYRNEEKKITIAIYEDGKVNIHGKKEYEGVTIEKMFEILENEIKSNNESINKGSLHFKSLWCDIMQNNLEDFLEEDMKKQVDNVLGTNDEDDELAQEYEDEYEDALAEEINDESYYGRDAGDVAEELEESLDEEESDDEEEEEEENYTSNNAPAIGRIGEIFAKKYLEELFKLNGVDLKVEKPEKENGKYDLKIYGNGKEYLVEVKFSTTKKHPNFKEIHFNNDFKYLLLIWHPDNKFYFSFLPKEEIIKNKYATPENANRKEDDNNVIQRTDILDESILNNLSRILEIDKDLIDLSDERKLEIYKEGEQETETDFEKLYEDVNKNTLYYKLRLLTNTERGKIAQNSIYNYLHNYDVNAENHNRGKFDILYKNKTIEIKFTTSNSKYFSFNHIKPENFDFLFLIGLDKKDKFYFDLMSKKEAKEKIGEDAYSENGSIITLGNSSFKFKNHLTIDDIDNYIESHSE